VFKKLSVFFYSEYSEVMLFFIEVKMPFKNTVKYCVCVCKFSC
jgi:hypothetical protein